MVKVLAILALALALMPTLVRAQGPLPPAPLPPAPPTSWTGIPDIVGYVTFTVQPPAWLLASCEAEPQGDWWNPAYQTQRLIWLVKDLFYKLFCLLLTLFQFLANVVAAALNAVLAGINAVWRFSIFAWLTIRSWLYAAWYLFEVLRDWLQRALEWLILCGQFVLFLVQRALDVLVVAGQIVLQLLSLAAIVLGLLSWVGGLSLGLLVALLDAFAGTNVPVALTSTHPIYRFVRGLGEGVRDSGAGWIFVLLWGMCYVTAVVWLSKFLSRSEQ